MNPGRIHSILLAAFCSINVSCTTNHVTVDDHSYHHNDVAPVNSVVYKNEIKYPTKIIHPKPPTIQQTDQDFLQFQQGKSDLAQEPAANTYQPSSYRYPPIPPNGGLYYPVRSSL